MKDELILDGCYQQQQQPKQTISQILIMKAKSQALVWLILIVCTCVILLNYAYRWPLYHMGIELILKMQEGQSLAFDWFFLLITMVIDPTIVFALCVLMMVLSHRKKKGFIMLMFIIINTFCAAVLKAYDSDPRPIWTQEKIRNIGFYCPVQFGNPSGHSWFSAVFGFGILLDYQGVGPNYVWLWVSLAAAVLMPLSRMYLGAHSLNQVLQGMLLGLAMCLLYPLKLKSLIRRYLKDFHSDNIWKLVIGACHIIYIIPYLAHRKEQLPPEWQKNILDKCNVVMNENKLTSLMFVVNAMLVSIAMGIGMGYSALEASSLGKHYLQGSWQINEQKYQLRKGYIYFIAIETGMLVSGLFVGGLVYFLFPIVPVAYVALSLGGIASGYLYTVKTCHYLEKYKIIRQIVP